jgi:hypothetical protein
LTTREERGRIRQGVKMIVIKTNALINLRVLEGSLLVDELVLIVPPGGRS